MLPLPLLYCRTNKTALPKVSNSAGNKTEVISKVIQKMAKMSFAKSCKG